MESKSMEGIRQYQPDDEIDLSKLFALMAKDWKLLIRITLYNVVVIALSISKQYGLSGSTGVNLKLIKFILESLKLKSGSYGTFSF